MKKANWVTWSCVLGASLLLAGYINRSTAKRAGGKKAAVEEKPDMRHFVNMTFWFVIALKDEAAKSAPSEDEQQELMDELMDELMPEIERRLAFEAWADSR